MKEPIILTKKNKKNDIVEVTAYHLQDLNVIENFSELRQLRLIGGHISDFQTLNCCTHLYELDLRLTEVDDFSALQEIKSIEELSIGGNHKGVIETVQNMSRLKQLSLKHCHLSNLRGLRNLTRLTSLSIDSIQSDPGIGEVMSIPSLKRLRLSIPSDYDQEMLDCFIQSMKMNLPNLEWLELEMPTQEFHPEMLHDLKLRHLSVTSRPFYL